MEQLATPSGLLLCDEDRADRARAGAKAAALAKLAREFDVPPFVVIPPVAFGVDGTLDPQTAAALATALQRLGPGPYAVRSSGIDEDSAEAAHAGQFRTELGVTREAVVDAAARVWRSGFSETLADYRRSQGLPAGAQPPAVIVQQMVNARAAGVAFSADPVTGERETVVIGAVAGLADRLVGGEADGDQYWIAAQGPPREPALAGATPVLDQGQRQAVAQLARRAQEFFGVPQDIEWAFDDRTLYLLQSRPITTLPDATGPDDTLTVWDNSNIVESYPGVVTPLTFTFARYIYAHVYAAFSRLMGVSRAVVDDHRAVFENMLGRIEGRVYYNLLNWYRALALFPGFRSNRTYMEGMMGAAPLPEETVALVAPAQPTNLAERIADRLRLGRVALGLAWQQLLLPRTKRRFYARLAQSLATPNTEIDAMPATALAAAYRELERRLLARWDAPLVNDFLCMIAFGASRKALERWAGEPGLALHADLLIGQGDIVSAEPAQRIRAMAAIAAGDDDLIAALAAADVSAVDRHPGLRAAFDEYIDKFGDRCAQELKLESVTLHDDPASLLRAVAAAARRPPERVARSADADTRLAQLFAGRPLRRIAARLLIRWAKARVRDRENLRFERTRLFGRVRRIFVALGRRFAAAGLLADERDIFFLTLDEALGAVEGAVATEDLATVAALRRREHEDFVARPDPPQRLTVHGAHALGLQSAETAPDAGPGNGETRHGLACCKGVVTAPVRVIEDPRTESLQPGEILVARHTDPGWIAAFAAAAGVIAERGSLLSHSAIVAREMGVPCVVAVAGVTGWLRSGDVVRLDGGKGSVQRVAAASDD